MPYVRLRTNKEISKETELMIKERLGRAITLLGKTEQWLMVDIVPNCHMYMGGEDNKGIAYVAVKLLGRSNDDAYNSFTKEVTDMMVSTGNIDPSDVYVSYEEHERWGWNGSNL